MGTSEGVVIAPAFVYGGAEAYGLQPPRYTVAEEDIEREVQRLNDAVTQTRTEIARAQKQLVGSIGARHAKIFDAQLMMLEDKPFIKSIEQRVREDRENVEAAFMDVTNAHIAAFARHADGYFRERIADIEDLARRVLHHLVGVQRPSLTALTQRVVVVAHDLSPSDTADMHRGHVVGMITQIGGPTSHTSIMARALEIPAVAGVHECTARIRTGDMLIVDGTKGDVIVRPTAARIAAYEREIARARERRARLLALRDLPTVTRDGHSIALLANIEVPQDADHAMEQGAEGVGLYRTEFFYMNREDLPGEDEQFEAYSYVAQRCGARPVVIRTLDLGGDKFVSSLTLPREMNPFMGWRAIRFCLERTDIFKTQLRAILRASALGNVRVMFPMIAVLHEVLAATRLIEEAKVELRREHKDFNPRMPIGAMIEIPSAALIADVLARHVDFFSIGTNDLIQYTLAIDRINEKTARMYDPFNLAVLRLIKTTVDAAHGRRSPADAEAAGAHETRTRADRTDARPIPVAVCGEVAANPLCALLLMGMGIDELSTVASYIPQNRELIRSLAFADAEKIARDALRQDTAHDVRTMVQNYIRSYTTNKKV